MSARHPKRAMDEDKGLDNYDVIGMPVKNMFKKHKPDSYVAIYDANNNNNAPTVDNNGDSVYSMYSTAFASPSYEPPKENNNNSNNMVALRTMAAYDDSIYTGIKNGGLPFVSRSFDGGYGSSLTGQVPGANSNGLIPTDSVYSDNSAVRTDDSDEPSVIPHRYLMDDGSFTDYGFTRLKEILRAWGYVKHALMFTYSDGPFANENPAQLLLPLQLVNLWLVDDAKKPPEYRKFNSISSVLNSFKLAGPTVAVTDNDAIFINPTAQPVVTTTMTVHLSGWTETQNTALHKEESFRSGGRLFITVKRVILDSGLKCIQLQLDAAYTNAEMFNTSDRTTGKDGSVGAVIPLSYINGHAPCSVSHAAESGKPDRTLSLPPSDDVKGILRCVRQLSFTPNVYITLQTGFARNLGMTNARFGRTPLTPQSARFFSY